MNSQGTAHHVGPGEGRSVDLGVASMRLVAGGQTTGRQYTLAEFYGTSRGAWTLPHLHEGFEESFFVLDGHFTFTVGDSRVDGLASSTTKDNFTSWRETLERVAPHPPPVADADAAPLLP